MTNTTNVSLIEDDATAAGWLIRLIEGTDCFTFRWHYLSAEAALGAMPRERPDMMLVDLQLPGMGGIECIRRLKRLLPDLLCVVVTQFDDSDSLFAALQAGADGYLLKRATPEQILEAIATVRDGGGFMSPSICRMVLEHFHAPRLAAEAEIILSPRELDLLQLARRGKRPKEIARALQLSYETVRTHFRNIYRKLQVTTLEEAVERGFSTRDKPAS